MQFHASVMGINYSVAYSVAYFCKIVVLIKVSQVLFIIFSLWIDVDRAATRA